MTCLKSQDFIKHTHKIIMDREELEAALISNPSEAQTITRTTRRTVTFHLPARGVPGPTTASKHDATSRFQEVVKHRKEQKSAREEHRRKIREARMMADEALEKVSPSALKTESY